MESAILRAFQLWNPVTDFLKNCTVGYVSDNTPHANIWISMREIVIVMRLFCFFG